MQSSSPNHSRITTVVCTYVEKLFIYSAVTNIQTLCRQDHQQLVQPAPTSTTISMEYVDMSRRKSVEELVGSRVRRFAI